MKDIRRDTLIIKNTKFNVNVFELSNPVGVSGRFLALGEYIQRPF